MDHWILVIVTFVAAYCIGVFRYRLAKLLSYPHRQSKNRHLWRFTCLWVLVEAGGVEPTVRSSDHKSFSERRLRFEFCPLAATADLRIHLDKSPLEPPRIGPRASPFKLRLIPGHGSSAGETLAAIKHRKRISCWHMKTALL